MPTKRARAAVVLALLAANAAVAARRPDPPFAPDVPRTWDDAAVAAASLPLADPTATPVPITSDYYYRIPVRPIYKSYPVYAPGREPAGYMASLAAREPEAAFDASKLVTKDDWIRAGELVFEAPISADDILNAADLHDPAWFASVAPPVAEDGTIPGVRYVVRESGKVEVGTLSCAMCHTRVLPDGAVVKGAQGNLPFDRMAAFGPGARRPVEALRAVERSLFGAPWVRPDPQAGLVGASRETMRSWHAAIVPGTVARQGSSPLAPLAVPDLIGVGRRAFLDHTGLTRHRSVGDLMRYAALNQGMDDLASYAGFVPAARDGKTAPPPESRRRYGDDQLYALALYLYSLTPPPNPNRPDALATRGKGVFEREGCASCHAPPLYTNNKLTLAAGRAPSAADLASPDVLPLSVGTDPTSATRTRRGTGYYKVPSLLGVWYRGPFEHNGSVATLEDWFDPRRLRDDYVPTGFRGAGVTHRAVKGHEYGLSLSAGDRRALVAFLRTL